MKRSISKILAGIIAAASIASLAACSDDADSGVTTVSTTEKTEWTGDNIEVTTAADIVDTTLDTQGKQLRWMGFYPIDASNDNPERSVEITLLEDVYGVTIDYMETTWGKRFETLSENLIGGTPPDVVVFDVSNFPNDVVNKDMFRSVDSIIDWSDPMWAEVKDTADKFMWDGEHYVAPFGYGFNDYQLLMYNKDLVDSLGLDDPYELFEQGKWDWDNFLRLMKEFQGTGEERYGIGGWWTNAILASSGDVFVTFDGSKFTNNLYSQKIERAYTVIADAISNDLVKGGWWGPELTFTDDDLLFYGMGTWAYQGAAESANGGKVQVIPFPKDPNADKYYMNKAILSHMWIKQSENDDVVKAWFTVNRLVNYDSQYYDVAKQKFLLNNSNWTEDIYDLVYSYNDDEKFGFNYEYGYGLSEDFCETGAKKGHIKDCQDGLMDGKFETWTQGREEFKYIFDTAIEGYNNR